jgi:hypothetical protein
MERAMEREAFLDGLEYQLVEGSARWVADFPEAIRNVKIGGVDFDLLVKGSTRGKTGYFLSAITARLTLPDYTVASLAKVRGEGWTPQGIQEVVGEALRLMDRFELAWSWLVLAQPGRPTSATKQAVRSINEKKIGVALVDLGTLEVVHSANFLGKNALRIIPKRQGKSLGRRDRPVTYGTRHAVQWSKVFGLFSGLLLLIFFLSNLALLLLADQPRVSVPVFVGGVILAAVLAYVIYVQLYHTDLAFDKDEFKLLTGVRRRITARWKDFDLVSLYHRGGGKYHLLLYRRGNHEGYVEIPASSVGLDPAALRWKAMELSAHGEIGYPAL